MVDLLTPPRDQAARFAPVRETPGDAPRRDRTSSPPPEESSRLPDYAQFAMEQQGVYCQLV